jgi:hypothetical protein
MKLLRLIICILLLILLWIFDALADTFEFSGVIPNSLESNHVNQCDPDCAEQHNGGSGFSVRYKMSEKYLDIGIGRMCFTNSYGDPGCVNWLQLARADATTRFFMIGVSAWRMEITGYKDAEGNPKTETIDMWPEFHTGIDVLYFFDRKPLGIKKIFIERSYINFISVSIQHSRISFQWGL